MASKLDMDKGYDRLEWPFIRKCLMDLGFSNKWINWIMEWMTITFQASVNGKPGAPFKSERGFRQGGQLSPYIFINVQNIYWYRHFMSNIRSHVVGFGQLTIGQLLFT